MRLKTDENIPFRTAQLLKAAFEDVLSVRDERMDGAADDDLWSACRRENRTLVTLDLDFADVRTYPPAATPGLVVLRPGSQSAASVHSVASRLVGALQHTSPAGALWVVNQQTIRVRT